MTSNLVAFLITGDKEKVELELVLVLVIFIGIGWLLILYPPRRNGWAVTVADTRHTNFFHFYQYYIVLVLVVLYIFPHQLYFFD